MVLKVRVQMIKDKSKKMKRAMMTTLETEIPGMERINAVSELPEGTPLAKELDALIEELLTLKKAEMKKDKKKLNKKAKETAEKLATKK